MPGPLRTPKISNNKVEIKERVKVVVTTNYVYVPAVALHTLPVPAVSLAIFQASLYSYQQERIKKCSPPPREWEHFFYALLLSILKEKCMKKGNREEPVI